MSNANRVFEIVELVESILRFLNDSNQQALLTCCNSVFLSCIKFSNKIRVHNHWKRFFADHSYRTLSRGKIIDPSYQMEFIMTNKFNFTDTLLTGYTNIETYAMTFPRSISRLECNSNEYQRFFQYIFTDIRHLHLYCSTSERGDIQLSIPTNIQYELILQNFHSNFCVINGDKVKLRKLRLINSTPYHLIIPKEELHFQNCYFDHTIARNLRNFNCPNVFFETCLGYDHVTFSLRLQPGKVKLFGVPTIRSNHPNLDSIVAKFKEIYHQFGFRKEIEHMELYRCAFAYSSLKACKEIKQLSLIDVNGMVEIPKNLPRVDKLLIGGTKAWKKIEELPVDHCYEELHFFHLENLQTVHFNFGNVRSIIFENCGSGDTLNENFLNGCLLEGVESVTLRNCSKIQNIGMLWKLRKVVLENCNNILYIKGLYKVPEVEIINCKNIQFYGAFTENQKITLRALTPIDRLSGIKILRSKFDEQKANQYSSIFWKR